MTDAKKLVTIFEEQNRELHLVAKFVIENVANDTVRNDVLRDLELQFDRYVSLLQDELSNIYPDW